MRKLILVSLLFCSYSCSQKHNSLPDMNSGTAKSAINKDSLAGARAADSIFRSWRKQDSIEAVPYKALIKRDDSLYHLILHNFSKSMQWRYVDDDSFKKYKRLFFKLKKVQDNNFAESKKYEK